MICQSLSLPENMYKGWFWQVPSGGRILLAVQPQTK